MKTLSILLFSTIFFIHCINSKDATPVSPDKITGQNAVNELELYAFYLNSKNSSSKKKENALQLNKKAVIKKGKTSKTLDQKSQDPECEDKAETIKGTTCVLYCDSDEDDKENCEQAYRKLQLYEIGKGIDPPDPCGPTGKCIPVHLDNLDWLILTDLDKNVSLILKTDQNKPIKTSLKKAVPIKGTHYRAAAFNLHEKYKGGGILEISKVVYGRKINYSVPIYVE